MMRNGSDAEIRTMLNEVRKFSDRMLNENGDTAPQENGNSVPYTMQDQLMSSIIETARTQFGADFSQSKNPMLYYPDANGKGDVTLSGTISSLNDAKFQFRYKDTDGCYVWVSPLILKQKTVEILSTIIGVYENWKQELNGTEDIKPMSLRDNESENEQPNTLMVPGDDF